MASKAKCCPKCGKEISGNDACMFCHIVPETYQKKWNKLGTKANVYYFDKSLQPITNDDKNNTTYDPNNGGNVKNFMGEWDYYILTKDDQKEIKDTPRCIENYFSKEIENLWSGVYELFIGGNIGKDKPKANKVISKSVCDVWKEHYATTKETVSAIAQSDFDGFGFIFNEIDKFIWMQHFRRLENMYPYLILLVKNEKFSPVAIFATETTKFILSDNPVIYNIGLRLDKNLGSGLYMAISPSVLIAYLDLSKWREKQPEMKKDDLIVVAGTDDFIQYYNKLLLDRSYTKVGFNSTDIKKHIATDLSKTYSFNEMFGIEQRSEF